MTEEVTAHIEAALPSIMASMREAFSAVGNEPAPGSSLDQVRLIDGDEVVTDYLAVGEAGLAFDHLLYMVVEPPLLVSESTLEHLRAASVALGQPLTRLDVVRVHQAERPHEQP